MKISHHHALTAGSKKKNLVDVVTVDDGIKAGENGVHATDGFHCICSHDLFDVGQLDEQNCHTLKRLI